MTIAYYLLKLLIAQYEILCPCLLIIFNYFKFPEKRYEIALRLQDVGNMTMTASILHQMPQQKIKQRPLTMTSTVISPAIVLHLMEVLRFLWQKKRTKNFGASWGKFKVERFLKGSLDSIPSPSVKIEIKGYDLKSFLL